jgi:hypothetical protein
MASCERYVYMSSCELCTASIRTRVIIYVTEQIGLSVKLYVGLNVETVKVKSMKSTHKYYKLL